MSSADVSRDAARVVLLCPGQGSQKPGMGSGLLHDREAARVLACASDVFGRDMAALVAAGSASELNDARTAQQAVAAVSIAAGRALYAQGVQPDALIGFSLGQISALALSGMLDDERTFELVDARSRIIAETAAQHAGAMTAILKARPEDVDALCAECSEGEVLVAANFNCPGQIVISGDVSAVKRAEELWARKGGRSARLACAGAFHSPLMRDAAAPFAAYLDKVEFAEPRVPLIGNADALPLSPGEAKAKLVAHLTGPVLFEQSVRKLVDAGPCLFIEAGFGGVLCGLVRRICKDAPRICAHDQASIDEAARLAKTA